MNTKNYYLTDQYSFYNFTDWVKKMMEIEGKYIERSGLDQVIFSDMLNAFDCNFIEIYWSIEEDSSSCTLICTAYECQPNRSWEVVIDGFEGLFSLLWDFVYQVKAKEKSLFSDPKDINKPIVLEYAPLLWELEKLLK